MAGGRPTKYTAEIADVICERLASGESMRSVSRDEEMPCMSTLFKWLRENEEFLQQYTRAKEESADALVEEMLDIADDATNDWMERHGAQGENSGWHLNGEHVQRSRVRIDTRKWIAAKLKPKKYSDKTIHAGDEDNPVRVEAKTISADLDPVEASRLYKEFLNSTTEQK